VERVERVERQEGYVGEDITYPLVSFSSISSDIPVSRGSRPASEWLGKLLRPRGSRILRRRLFIGTR